MSILPFHIGAYRTDADVDVADGHWWPESYYLGTIQARQAFLQILRQYVTQGDFTLRQAVNIAKNAFFHTANRVYNLGLDPVLEG